MLNLLSETAEEESSLPADLLQEDDNGNKIEVEEDEDKLELK